MNAELPFKLVPVSPPSVGGPMGIATEDYRKKVRSVFHELRAKHQLPAPPRDAIHLDDVAWVKQLELF